MAVAFAAPNPEAKPGLVTAYSAPLAYHAPLAYSAPVAYAAPSVVSGYAAPSVVSGYSGYAAAPLAYSAYGSHSIIV